MFGRRGLLEPDGGVHGRQDVRKSGEALLEMYDLDVDPDTIISPEMERLAFYIESRTIAL